MKHRFISLAVLGILLVLVISSTLTSAQITPSSALDQIRDKITESACWILSILITIVAAVGALFMVLSGIKYMASGDDPHGRQEAKSRLTWALIGLTIAVIACPLVDYLSIPPLQGGCYNCWIEYGIPVGPTPPGFGPPGGIPGGDPEGPIVTIDAKPLSVKPNEIIHFKCSAKARSGNLHPNGIIYYEEYSSGPTDTVGITSIPSPGPSPEGYFEKDHVYPNAGTYIPTCWFWDDATPQRTGWAQQIIIVANESHPAAVIDSIGGKSLAELMKDNRVERDLRKNVSLKGHMGGGTGDPRCKWELAGNILLACEGSIMVDPKGTYPATFKVKAEVPGEEDQTSITINVIETTEKPECAWNENCTATDTDGGNKPEKKGTCTEQECEQVRGYCKDAATNPDKCESNHLDLMEFYPGTVKCRYGVAHPSDICTYECGKESINCYEYCGGRGGECEWGADKCRCFKESCIMKPRAEFTGVIELHNGDCHLRGEIGTGPTPISPAYIDPSKPAGESPYFYHKTPGTLCTSTALSVTPSSDYSTNSDDRNCDSGGGYPGTCKLTISYYEEGDGFFSVCIEDVG